MGVFWLVVGEFWSVKTAAGWRRRRLWILKGEGGLKQYFQPLRVGEDRPCYLVSKRLCYVRCRGWEDVGKLASETKGGELGFAHGTKLGGVIGFRTWGSGGAPDERLSAGVSFHS